MVSRCTAVDVLTMFITCAMFRPVCGRATRIPGKACSATIDIASALGVRIARMQGSRVQYEPVYPLGDRSSLSVEFKTRHSTGLLFLASSENLEHRSAETPDSVALYLQQGHLRYYFNCGNTNGLLTMHEEFNDNSWHKVEFTRIPLKGMVKIDDEKPFRDYVHTCAPFNHIYLGGLPQRVRIPGFSGLNQRLNGCLRNFRIDEVPVEGTPHYSAVFSCD
ncbi:unnamed protein product [Owenia fusiformis]|uniref:Uncharacterized protein n=1 Tax=Owenia fusiformis TaxID=6347 RepID=A0A8J1UR50_OWEFU|nr:unnamed protein product [Owenia fusiformis]